ncbi:MAG: type II toxin-antitoxin system RelE/ParE family toxin [Desulfobacterales bacterium]|nr:type II toxin-antitoxin system RelE/ParE family toxin [Desulfobacterales bacterium]
MIRTFADRRTRDLFTLGTAKRFPPDVAGRAARKLEYVDLATSLDDLKVPPGNRLHALKDDRQGQHAIAVNDRWRICFRFVDGDAYDVEVCDYH